MNKPLKLTIIANKKDGWHQQQLLIAAKKQGFNAVINDIVPTDMPDNLNSKLGDAVIWRSATIDAESERTSLSALMQNKIVVSDSVFELPIVRFKYFQQNSMKSQKAMSRWSIPTYRPRTLSELKKYINIGKLHYPIIVKPNVGSQGVGILLLHNDKDAAALTDFKRYIFQNFISNDGDWRIIIVGGTPLGAIKRTAPKGGYLNNISQGATAKAETDPAVLSQLYKISTKTASLFHLAFCGVDVIRDANTGQFHVLEVNTAPQWNDEFGFQSIMGVDVPGCVMRWIEDRHALQSGKLAKHVESYYKHRIGINFMESFHFASRLWLWSGDKWARDLLDTSEQKYIGITPAETTAILKRILKQLEDSSLVNQWKASRRDSFQKYPMLSRYISVLFKALFAQSIYGHDLRPMIKKLISDDEFLKLFNELAKDEDAVRLLSTHAVNYFYLLKAYYRDDLSKKEVHEFNPEYLLTLIPGYKKLEDKGVLDHKTSLKQQVYLLTHAVIGESAFYASKIEDELYKKLCRRLEDLIDDNYFEIGLDNKFEFLVCAEICGYKSVLVDRINQEARESVSWAGNFLVDTLNVTGGNETAHCLRSSEHRNVLYLMSQRIFKQSKSGIKKDDNSEVGHEKVIGSFEKVSLPDFNLIDVIAKIDTGATTGSLHATEITERILPTGEKVLRFMPYGQGPAVVVKSFKLKKVRSSNGRASMRYIIPTTIIFGGVQYPIRLSLADRTPMKKGILIGRRFLRGNGFVVDVKRGTKYRGEVKPQ